MPKTREEYFEIIKKNYGFALGEEEVMSQEEYKKLVRLGLENKTFKQKSLMLAFKFVTHFYVEKAIDSQTFEDALQTTFLLVNDFLKTPHWRVPEKYVTFKRNLGKYLEGRLTEMHEKAQEHNQDLNFSHIVTPDQANDPEIDELADKVVNRASLRAGILKGMKTLDGCEQVVLKLRYGLEDNQPKSQAKVGQKENLSSTRIGQIEAKALRKMRHPSRAKNYKEFA